MAAAAAGAAAIAAAVTAIAAAIAAAQLLAACSPAAAVAITGARLSARGRSAAFDAGVRSIAPAARSGRRAVGDGGFGSLPSGIDATGPAHASQLPGGDARGGFFRRTAAWIELEGLVSTRQQGMHVPDRMGLCDVWRQASVPPPTPLRVPYACVLLKSVGSKESVGDDVPVMLADEAGEMDATMHYQARSARRAARPLSARTRRTGRVSACAPLDRVPCATRTLRRAPCALRSSSTSTRARSSWARRSRCATCPCCLSRRGRTTSCSTPRACCMSCHPGSGAARRAP